LSYASFHERLTSVITLVNIVEVEDLRVPARPVLEANETESSPRFSIHHDLPGIHRKVGVIERPIKLLLGLRLVGRVVVGREVFVRKCFPSADSLLGIENEHSLQEIDR
jgi:hypothetical protein